MLGLGCLGGTSTPQAGRHRGQPLCVPSPISDSLACPGCLVVLGPLPVAASGVAGDVPVPRLPK